MNVPQIRIKTEGYRAINSADILLNGITLVAGENGSGKSTLSKLLYFLVKTATNFDGCGRFKRIIFFRTSIVS